MPRAPSPTWIALGAELRKLRSLSGLSTRDLAARTALSNARVSRVETGRSLLSMAEVDAWAGAVGGDPAARRLLHELAERAHTPTVETVALTGDADQQFAELEASTHQFDNVSPLGIPGLLQTPGYAQAATRLADLGGTRDIPKAVRDRMQRQDILYRPGVRFRFLLTEAGLRWPLAGLGMVAQYGRLLQLSTATSIEIGVVPFAAKLEALPWWSFWVYSDRTGNEPPVVHVEIPDAAVWIREPDRVPVYVELADRLWRSAATGDEARALILGAQEALHFEEFSPQATIASSREI